MTKMLSTLAALAVSLPMTAQEPRQLTPAFNEIAALGEGGVFGVTESPDGRFVLYNGPVPERPGDLQWTVYDRSTGRTRRVFSGQGMEVVWSPLGHAIAFSRPDDRSDFNHIWTQRINVRTGELIGLARRVSVSPGRGPVWSPDGKSIAFVALPATDTVAPRIIVVPAEGGPERVVVRSAGFAQQLTWSPDGQAIYYRTRISEATGRTLSRVNLRDGSVQALKRVRDVLRGVGDQRFIAYVPMGAEPVISIATLDGVDVGQFKVRGEFVPQQWTNRGLRLLAPRNQVPSVVRVAPITGGPARVLSRSRSFDDSPAFAPDSRSIALVSKLGERRQLFVQPLNGARRHIPTRAEPGAWLLWSPDARYIAFPSNGTQLNVVELASGAESVLLRAERLGSVRWRRDSRALQVAAGSQDRTELREVTLGGASSVLRQLDKPINALQITFATDTTVLIGEAGTLRLGSLRGGADRELVGRADPASGGWPQSGVGVSRDGAFIALSGGQADPQRADRFNVYIIDLNRGTRRTVSFDGMMLGGNAFRWHPDGRHLINDGELRDGAVGPILFPLNGDAPRPLSDPKGGDFYSLDVAPDGSAIAFASGTTPWAELWEIDLTRALARYQPISNGR